MGNILNKEIYIATSSGPTATVFSFASIYWPDNAVFPNGNCEFKYDYNDYHNYNKYNEYGDYNDYDSDYGYDYDNYNDNVNYDGDYDDDYDNDYEVLHLTQLSHVLGFLSEFVILIIRYSHVTMGIP